MAVHTRGLGKGLGALLGNTADQDITEQQVRPLPLTSIVPNPHQPRQHFSEQALQELAQSIQTQGVLQPILVRPGKGPGQYELIAGERRLRASEIAGLQEIPALIRDITDQESIAIALIENLQREDLNPLEEAMALHSLKDQLGLSQEELATKVGRSRSAVANSLRLLQLPAPVQGDLQAGEITSGHARAILAIADAQAQQELALLIKNQELNVRQAEKLAGAWKKNGGFGSNRKPDPSPDQAAFTESLRDMLSKQLSCSVHMKGSRKKGSITLKYKSTEELDGLLKSLGLSTDEGGIPQ